ncbi:MAG: hypothetical protein AAGB34_10795 [Planctomycetota bacterium]
MNAQLSAMQARVDERVTFAAHPEGGAQPMRWATDIFLIAIVLACFPIIGNARSLAEGPLAFTGWSGPLVFDLAMLTALLLGTVSILRLFARIFARARTLNRAVLRDQRGTIAVEFILVFIPFALMVGATMQMALLGHSAIIVRYSAFAAARAAMVHTARSGALGNENVTSDGNTAAHMAATLVLAPISPEVGGSPPSQADKIITIRSDDSAPYIDNAYDQRAKFAFDNTTVNITLQDPDFQMPVVGEIGIPNPIGPRSVNVVVTYPVLLQAPGVSALLSPTTRTLSGKNGHYFDLSAEVELQSTGPREMGALPLIVDFVANILTGGGTEPSLGRPL